MRSHCKVCGDVVGARPPDALADFGLTEWPEWLQFLCGGCLYDLSWELDSVERGEGDDGPITEADFTLFLAARFHEYAHRAARNKTVEFCEAIGAGWKYYGDQDAGRCRRFGDYERDGHRVCRYHAADIDKRRPVAFTKLDDFPPRMFCIWASSGAQLVAEANRIACGFAKYELD